MNKQIFFLLFFLTFFNLKGQEGLVEFNKDEIIQSGRKAFFNKNLPELIEITNRINSFYLLSNDSVLLAKNFHFKALQNKLTYNNDSAFYYYQKSIDISKLINDSLAVGRRLLSMAVLQRNAKDYLGSEISSIEALKYLEPLNSHGYLESLYNNLGLVSEELNQDEDAIKYYKKAYQTGDFIENKNRKELSYIRFHNNLGLLYQRDSSHQKAVEYFKKGLMLDSLKQKHPTHYALLLENLTYSEYKLGIEKNTEKKYHEVLTLRNKLKEENEVPATFEVPTTLNNLANFHFDKKNYSTAKAYANEALKHAKQTHNNKRWLEALELLSYLTTGKESKEYLREYIGLNDSLFQQERQLKNQFAKIRYETEKTEKENADLKIENEKTLAEAEAQKQRATIGLLLSGISIMFLLSSISFFRFRRKKLLFLAQLQKIEAREQERRQIAKSLHDEVAGDLRLLHRKLEKSLLLEEAQKLELVKDNVRNLSHQLSSVSFEEVPFRDQILNLVSDYFSPEFIIKVNGLKEIEWSQANNSIKRMLYLSLRECIQNCQKYAEASKMTISFSIHKKSVLLDVVDNGKGFDTATQKKGIGLLNLQERVHELNGTLTIESEVGKGTHIIIQIPLNV
jgi:signal transduction histidine kinase